MTDVDRAKEFYAEVGFVVDHDHTVSDEVRFVQLTPPGSACSIAIGRGLTADGARVARQPADGRAPTRMPCYAELRERGVEAEGVDRPRAGAASSSSATPTATAGRCRSCPTTRRTRGARADRRPAGPPRSTAGDASARSGARSASPTDRDPPIRRSLARVLAGGRGEHDDGGDDRGERPRPPSAARRPAGPTRSTAAPRPSPRRPPSARRAGARAAPRRRRPRRARRRRRARDEPARVDAAGDQRGGDVGARRDGDPAEVEPEGAVDEHGLAVAVRRVLLEAAHEHARG